MKKFDIIALGELNVDLLLNKIGGFPEVGKEIFAKEMTLTLGSSTAIFAANAASLGAKVSFLGMVGNDDFGAFVRTSLEKRGVDTSNLIEVSTAATGLTAILNYDQDRANVTYPGAMSIMGVKDIRPEVIAQAKHVHISSIFLQETLHKDIYEIVKLVKDNGATLSMDMQFDPEEKWDFDYKKILPLVDIFMPNIQELTAVTGKKTLEEAVAEVRPYINVLVVKMGSKGSTVVTKEGEKFLPAMLNSNVVDAIGAGDSFNSGFITAFVQGKDLEYCQYLGNLTGAINTTAAGGTGAFTSKEAVEDAALRYFNQAIIL
ncbi:MAG: carbohydrate kinase family protein [Bacteroidales bacterium]|nr:carbohydrate kinase family protein [Bacteroidales bacterium]MCR5363503.1 carbohydrate kinase family protein [Bacteroidales bacterium]MDT3361149.1 carbohydrate kinase family protein [Bacteroidota bacterium]